jgi:3-oxoacyl-[acyl-carrier-protein] synthase-3
MAHLAGFGAALPEAVVTNLALAEEFQVTEEWILSVSGIRERRRAAEGESPAALAEIAARKALEGAALSPSGLGAILVGSGSSPRQFPGISADLQRRIGALGIPAFDVPLASAGGLVALALAVDLAPRYGPVLVVGAEVMSRVLDRPPRSKETAILFGDGAGACVVAPGPGPVEVTDARFASDGSLGDDLSLDAGGPLVMNGRTVILQASRKLPAAVRDVLGRAGLSPSDVDLFVFHQANLVLLRQVAKTLGVEESRLFVNVDRYGNTSAASLLIALAEAHGQGLLSPGRRVVLGAFGAGFSWGAALLSVRG